MSPGELERIRTRDAMAKGRLELLTGCQADRSELLAEVDRLTGVLEQVRADNRLLGDLLHQATKDALTQAAEVAHLGNNQDGLGGNDWFPTEWADQVAGWLQHRAEHPPSEGGS